MILLIFYITNSIETNQTTPTTSVVGDTDEFECRDAQSVTGATEGLLYAFSVGTLLVFIAL